MNRKGKGKISEITISRLTSLEQESLEWCYERYRQWVEANKGCEKDVVILTAFVKLVIGEFQEGELEAFRSLRRKGIIHSMQKLKNTKENVPVQYHVWLDDTIVEAYQMLQQMKIAIFDHFDMIPDVPEEYPSGYAMQDFDSRHAFAEWLKQNGQQYLYEGDEKLSPYQYYIYEKSSARKDRFFVAIVPVDLSKPWFIHSSGGREKIWYLDKKDEHNMVNPDVQPQVVSYGLGGDTCVVGK